MIRSFAGASRLLGLLRLPLYRAAPGDLALAPAAPGVSGARLRAHPHDLLAGPRAALRSLDAARVAQAALLAAIVGLGVLLRAINLFNFPRYGSDEGVYMAAAWAVAHGQIFPYTYSYGHPPLGWILISLWCQATGGFFTFGTAIDTGRVFMVVLYAVAALFVYLIGRRVSGSPWVGLVAVAIFALSPLGVLYQREVLLDNLMTFWVVVALYLLVVSDSRLRYILASAVALACAFLSKETGVVFIPAFVYGAWVAASRFERRYAVIVFTYTTLALGSVFVLVAALKNELFPVGTLLGGSAPHVSLITTLLQQAGRGGDQGSFAALVGVWVGKDWLLAVVGVAGVALNLVYTGGRPFARCIALLALTYGLFLARGGVTFDFYIIPMIPLLALNMALAGHTLLTVAASAMARLPAGPRLPAALLARLARWLAPTAALLALLLLLPYAVSHNQENLTIDETSPQVAALQWMGQNVPRSAYIIVDHYDWVDLHGAGGTASAGGAPFFHTDMYWELATDPAIASGVYHNDWNRIDYIMADSGMLNDVAGFHMTLLQQALNHAVLVQRFQNDRLWVGIYQVQHIGGAAAQDPLTALAPASPATP
jgi:4-amino-4-deoxy-L-arabinose transferase-like glycosyltransferase